MAKSRKPKPSFDRPADSAPADPAWVYRSDAAPAKPGKTGARAKSDTPALASPPTIVNPQITDSVTQAPSAAPRAEGAERIVQRYAKYSASAGLVPLPIVDVAAITAVQVSMVKALSAHYGVAYSRERGKTLVAALIGGLMPSLAGHQVLKAVGPLAGMASVSGFAFAATGTIGRMFIGHFEAGGTLLDFDPRV
jgi:uncharacterized protein (DUF697 family)